MCLLSKSSCAPTLPSPSLQHRQFLPFYLILSLTSGHESLSLIFKKIKNKTFLLHFGYHPHFTTSLHRRISWTSSIVSNSSPHISSTTLPFQALLPLLLRQRSCQSHCWLSPSSSSLMSQQHLTQDTFPFLKHFILQVIPCSPASLPTILAGSFLLTLHAGISSLLHFWTLVLPLGLLLKPVLSYRIYSSNLL